MTPKAPRPALFVRLARNTIGSSPTGRVVIVVGTGEPLNGSVEPGKEKLTGCAPAVLVHVPLRIVVPTSCDPALPYPKPAKYPDVSKGLLTRLVAYLSSSSRSSVKAAFSVLVGLVLRAE